MQTFLSYKRESQTQVQKIHDSLIGWGYEPWMDVYKIPKGIVENTTTWMDHIDKGLLTSRVMIACITPAAFKSQNVRQEWVWARLAERRMIFVRLEPFDNENMPHQFAGVNYIDFVTDFDTGLAELKAALDEYAASPQAQTPLNDVAWPSTTRILYDLDELAKIAPKTTNHLLKKADDDSFSQFRDRVRRYWLEGALRPSLEEVKALGIPVSLNTQAVVKHRDWLDPAKHTLDIWTVYTVLRSFAILGDPGSGKTTVVMQLALELLKNDALRTTPCLLNLSSWRPDNTLRDWILSEGAKTYHVTQGLMKRWLDDKRLILLLDGFDEIPEEHRAACITAINAFRAENRAQEVVITTRTAEFRLASNDMTSAFDLNGAIELGALTDVQVEAFMKGAYFDGLRKLYAENAAIRQMAGIPFLLNCMGYVYAGWPYEALEPELNTIPQRQKHLFDAYIEKRLNPLPPYYTLPQMKQWLGWLAIKIGYYGTIFRPDDVTLRWFDDVLPQLRNIKRTLFFLGIGLLLILWMGISIFSWAFGIVIGVILFLLMIQSRIRNAIVLSLSNAIDSEMENVIDRFIGRLLLMRTQPIRIWRYLNFASSRQILREMGGGHTFRHDTLRLTLLGTSAGAKAQIEALIRDLDSLSRHKAAIEALAVYGELATELLIAALGHEKDFIRANAVEALGEIGDAGAIEPLITALKYGDWEVRRGATIALGLIGDARAVEPLITALKYEDLEVRRRAAMALESIGDSRAVEPLIAVLKDRTSFIRKGATTALGKIRDPRAVEPLIAALKDEEDFVRKSAADALRKIGTPEALEALKKAGH